MVVAELLSKRRIGAVLVKDDDGDLIGIISERDIVIGVAHRGPPALEKPVSDLMTKDVITCSPADQVIDVMGKMTDRRIRHLPVIDDNTVVGVISIGDVVKQRIAESEHEAEALREYIATG